MVKFPLFTAAAISEVTLDATSESVPLKLRVPRRRVAEDPRATYPSRRTCSSKKMSTFGGDDDVPLTLRANMSVIWDVSETTLFRTRTKTFFIAFFIAESKEATLNPESRRDDCTTANLNGANVGCCVGCRVGIGVGSAVGFKLGNADGTRDGMTDG